ncbi:MAG: tRNA dihydrouridine synthase DusB [Magnetococcales bacterium]|nr:tRNA dihydrouridine synthase DusB [Magnetococcales bacterium]
MALMEIVERLEGAGKHPPPPPLLFLAPMAGVADPPFRAMARRHGAEVTVSEMLASQALIRGKVGHADWPEGEAPESPRILQIAGGDPDVLARAARAAADQGAEGIDINMGCPVPKIVKTGSGAALLKDPNHALRCLEAVMRAVPLPVSIKIRTGWESHRPTGLEIARGASALGAAWIAVHGRSRAQMYEGRADWSFIRQVREETTVPVIGNGDVQSPQEALRMVRETGCAGVMIGRGALGRPWLFAQCAAFLRLGQTPPPPPLAEQYRIVAQFYETLLVHYGEEAGNRMGRKHLAWFTRGLPHGARLRQAVNHAPTPAATRELLRRFYGELLDHPPEEKEPDQGCDDAPPAA